MIEKIKMILKNEYIYSIITRCIVITISLVQSILCARYLGASLKGTSTYISSIASIGSIVVTFGMHQAYPYFRKKYGKEKIYRDYMSLIVLLYVIYLAIAIMLSAMLFKTPEVRAAIIMTPIMGYANVVGYVCLIENPNKRNSWWTIITVIDVLFVAILFLFTKSSFFWAVAILIFADAIKAIVYTVELKVKPRYHLGMGKLLKDLFTYGFFPMLALLMTTLNYRIDVLMLKNYSYISAAEIGVYSIGISFAEKIVLIPDTLAGILASKLARGAKNEEVARICRLCFWATCFVCIVFLVFGGWFIPFLYGNEYTNSFDVLAISALGSVFIGYFKLISQYNIINKKQINNVIMLSVAIVVDVIGNIIFVPVWGINGAALATGLGNLICGVVFVVWFSRKTHIGLSKMITLQKDDMSMIKSFIRR